jgi:hypothetical protein
MLNQDIHPIGVPGTHNSPRYARPPVPVPCSGLPHQDTVASFAVQNDTAIQPNVTAKSSRIAISIIVVPFARRMSNIIQTPAKVVMPFSEAGAAGPRETVEAS